MQSRRKFWKKWFFCVQPSKFGVLKCSSSHNERRQCAESDTCFYCSEKFERERISTVGVRPFPGENKPGIDRHETSQIRPTSCVCVGTAPEVGTATVITYGLHTRSCVTRVTRLAVDWMGFLARRILSWRFCSVSLLLSHLFVFDFCKSLFWNSVSSSNCVWR
jgi:hypothetical protein